MPHNGDSGVLGAIGLAQGEGPTKGVGWKGLLYVTLDPAQFWVSSNCFVWFM